MLSWRFLVGLPSLLQETGQLIKNEIKIYGKNNGGDEPKYLQKEANTMWIQCQIYSVMDYADDDDSVTPAAFEEPSEYLDTAIIEMMKKIMEAVTHLMKSFERKTPELIQRHNQTLHD